MALFRTASAAATFAASAAVPEKDEVSEGLGCGESLHDRVDVVPGAGPLEVLRHLARGYLYKEIALRLGYAEPASFTHAFKRWKGVSPATYREQRSANAL